jgi:hypothetical protein
MKLLRMQRREEANPEEDIRLALAEFQAQLVALHRRQRFTVCGPKANVRRPLSLQKRETKKHDPRLKIRCGDEDAGTDSTL